MKELSLQKRPHMMQHSRSRCSRNESGSLKIAKQNWRRGKSAKQLSNTI